MTAKIEPDERLFVTEKSWPSLPSMLSALTEEPTFTSNWAIGFVVPIPTIPDDLMRSLSAVVAECLVWIAKSAEEFKWLFNALKLTRPLPFPSVNSWIPAAFVAEEELTFPTANWATVAFAAYAVLSDSCICSWNDGFVALTQIPILPSDLMRNLSLPAVSTVKVSFAGNLIFVFVSSLWIIESLSVTSP